MSEQGKALMVNTIIIHPTKYLKMRVFLEKGCSGESLRPIFDKILMFKRFPDFIKHFQKTAGNQIAMKFINSLPKSLSDIYEHEKLCKSY
jgi:hypothetical protein